MERCSIRDAALKLYEWFLADGAKPALHAPPQHVAAETERDGTNKPLKFTLKGVASTHTWLESRGIAKATAATFGVGFFPGKGMMAGRIVIPIHNSTGELVAYAGRAVDDTTEPRYLLPSGFVKVNELYNLHRAIAAGGSRGVVVVEGFFDAMKVYEAGYPAVIALMGSSLSDTQAELIATNFTRAIVMLDGDDAGREALPAVLTQLARLTDVRVAQLPPGSQPDTLSQEQIREVLRCF
jgi:DNA primase